MGRRPPGRPPSPPPPGAAAAPAARRQPAAPGPEAAGGRAAPRSAGRDCGARGRASLSGEDGRDVCAFRKQKQSHGHEPKPECERPERRGPGGSARAGGAGRGAGRARTSGAARAPGRRQRCPQAQSLLSGGDGAVCGLSPFSGRVSVSSPARAGPQSALLLPQRPDARGSPILWAQRAVFFPL